VLILCADDFKWNSAKAFDQLNATLRWRVENQIESIIGLCSLIPRFLSLRFFAFLYIVEFRVRLIRCALTSQDEDHSNMDVYGFIHGHDRGGHPIVINTYGAIDTKSWPPGAMSNQHPFVRWRLKLMVCCFTSVRH
jgi:hypothetical protein